MKTTIIDNQADRWTDIQTDNHDDEEQWYDTETISDYIKFNNSPKKSQKIS
jgi:hypothetical protein